MNHGIKVSKPGYDVQTATLDQLSLHSDYTAFKARIIGSTTLEANTWKQIDHNFGYAPNYCGWYTGSRYGISGIIPFGYNIVDTSLISYTTDTSLFLKCNQSCTVYYYILAEIGGAEPTTPPALPIYGGHGLMISKEGVDVLVAQPYELNFYSQYPNFKLNRSFSADGLAITPTNGTSNIGSGDTTINFQNASNYGLRGKAVITGYQMINYDDYHWCYAEAPASSTIVDDKVSGSGVMMTVYYNNGSDNVSGLWTPGSGFEGNVRWHGTPIQFEYYLNGNWKQINGANSWTFDWNTLTGTNIKNWYHNGNDMWLDCYELQTYRPVTNINLGGKVQEYKEEKITFTGASSTQFTGVTRGVDSTTAREWKTGGNNFYRIAPIQTITQVGTKVLSYNPAFFAWGITPYDLNFNSSCDVVLSGNTYYLNHYRSWGGSSDGWLTQSLPYTTQGIYIKEMIDELGT